MKKTVLFRFEKDKIHFLECNIDNGNLIIGDKDNMSLEFVETKGEKYNKVMDEIIQINAKYSPDIIIYQSSLGYRGNIEEERFANEAILNLFCYQNSISLLEMSWKNIKKIASLSNEEYKQKIQDEEIFIIEKFKIAKSNKILESLVSLSIIKNLI